MIIHLIQDKQLNIISMNKIKQLWLLLVAFVALPALAQQMPSIPNDPAVRIGKLPNGLTYYIRHNNLPENRANFYIAQKVGSVQEEESQRGLAHFLEHMCFNGTTHFPDDALIKYCERIGVKFGQNLNAYTTTDETVYNIDDVPVTDNNVDSCLLILHDWSDCLTLSPTEIDKERGVIHEEWRMRSSASGRIFERNLSTLYPGSRYGHRYPIGLMSVIDNFKPEELRAYYEKWYRPDLQGIIVVGDIDVDKVEAKIKEMFADIKMPENAAKYEHYPVPDNNAPIFVIDKDKEQANTLIEIMFKHDPLLPEEYKNTFAYFTINYVKTLALGAFNARLSEIAQKADAPFVYAGADDDHYILAKTKDCLSISIVPKPGRDKEAIEMVMKEVKRVDEYGFTGTELNRVSEEFINSLETTYNNREKQRNDFYVPQYVRHFLENNPIPSVETQYNSYKQIAQMFNQQHATVEMSSNLFKELTSKTDTNFVCLAMYPEKEGVAIPTVEDFKQSIANAKAAKVEAYVDNVKNEPLVPVLPKKGKIVKESKADFGYTCWTLKNGARVFFKQTDFDDSEIKFTASSFGGRNAIIKEDRVNAKLMPIVMGSTGLGNFTSTELQKKIAGKQVSCDIDLGNTTENLIGTSTPKDLRTLFELIYLRFQKPCNDPEAYQSTINTLRTTLANADKQPMKVFSDSVTVTLYSHNPDMSKIKLADLDKANYETIKKMYSERFNAGGDFDFYFTGAINVDSLREFTEQYIAPLKAVKSREQYPNISHDMAEGTVNNHFFRKMETPQAIVIQFWHGKQPYSLKESAIVNALGSVLTQRYLKSIREDAGIAYSVFADASAEFGQKETYHMIIQCPVKPAKLDSALLLMQQGIDDIAAHGVTTDELAKVKAFELKDYADSQKKNSYWEGLIINKTAWNKDTRTGYEDIVKNVTSKDIQDFVNTVLLKQHNCITISMRPTDFTEKDGAK